MPEIYPPEERRRHPVITEELIEEIAEKASDRAIAKLENKIYQKVGRTFINRLFQAIGAVIVAVALYLNSKGYLTFGDK